MTVYVDDMYLYPMGEFTNPRTGRKMKMSHMVADTSDELHAMADNIGLARQHYQGDHYDVSMSLRRKAIEAGAVAITWRELGRITLERRRTMARGRKPKAETNKAVAGLLDALKFIEPASSDIGDIVLTHCGFMGNGYVAQFNRLIMLAAKVDTDIIAYPNTKRLIAVLSKCDEPTQITQLDNNRLGIKAGKFSAIVPCVEPGMIAFTPPDPPQGAINDSVLASLGIVGVNVKENAPRMVQASVLLRNNSAVSTDGVIIFESWHGTPMPEVCLPKVFVTMLLNIKKKATHCGISATTFTVHFEDGSFIRTQLYTDKYPDVDRVLNSPSNQMPIPPEFWPAVEKLASMRNETNDIYFNAKGEKLQTDMSDGVGASYEYNHPMPDGIVFNIELLRRFAPHAKTADFGTGPGNGMGAFYGDNFRGMLMQKRINREQPPASPQTEPPSDMTRAYNPADINAALQRPGFAGTTGEMLSRHGSMDDEIPF